MTLEPGESGHCIRVLRLGKGDSVQVIDGKGGLYEAVIVRPDARSCLLEITSARYIEQQRNFNLHIAIAPTKSIDRFEWFVEKAVEIGIDTITPLLCQRSERKEIKIERFQKLIISAMKQAMVLKTPVIEEMIKFSDFVNKPSNCQHKYIAHCQTTDKQYFAKEMPAGQSILFLIGPEGDFTEIEINLALKNEFIPVSLGNNRLRTETAGLFICSAFNFLNHKTLS